MQSRKVTVVALDVVLAVLAIAAVIVRLICRSVKRNSLGTDDYTVIVALVLSPYPQVLMPRLMLCRCLQLGSLLPA